MPNTKNRLILVIEDNPVVSTVVRKYTERDPVGDLQVRIATDGLAGFQDACAHRPDVILLDLMMPNYDGRAFLELQKNEPKLAGVPVVVYSAATREEIEAVQRDYPMVKGVLQKPVTPSHLVKTLRETMPEK